MDCERRVPSAGLRAHGAECIELVRTPLVDRDEVDHDGAGKGWAEDKRGGASDFHAEKGAISAVPVFYSIPARRKCKRNLLRRQRSGACPVGGSNPCEPCREEGLRTWAEYSDFQARGVGLTRERLSLRSG